MPPDSPPPAPSTGIAPMPVEPAPVTSVDQGVLEDANSGRSWLSPTALTDPKGTWSFSDYELLAVGVGYSPTDHLSLSATTLLPLTEDFPLLLFLNAKLQVVKSGNLRVALQGAILHFRESSGSTTVSATAGDVGAVATLCLDIECHSHLSGFLAAGFAYEEQAAVPFLVAASLAYRVGKHVKLILEVDSGFIAGDGVTVGADGFLLFYGVRFTSRNIGVDLALAKPICEGCNDGLVLGIPFVAFTYRSI